MHILFAHNGSPNMSSPHSWNLLICCLTWKRGLCRYIVGQHPAIGSYSGLSRRVHSNHKGHYRRKVDTSRLEKTKWLYMLRWGGTCSDGSRVTKSDVMVEAEIRERDLKLKCWILWSLMGYAIRCLPSGVFSGCNFQHVECLTWLWMFGTGFEVSDLFVLYDPGCEVSDLCVGVYPGCKVTNLFVRVHLRTWALWSVYGCIPYCVRAHMFPCVICRFLRCHIAWCLSKDVKSLRGSWVYFPTCVIFLSCLWCVIQNVSLSTLCVFCQWVSDLFMAIFPGFYLTCFRVCISESVIFTLFVGKHSPDKKSLICLSLYVPGCNVCEWIVGMFYRILCLWSVWGYVSKDVSFLNYFCAYFPACEVCKHFVTICPRIDISDLFMCIVKLVRSLICFLLFVPGWEISNCLWVYVPGCVVSDLFVGIYHRVWGL